MWLQTWTQGMWVLEVIKVRQIFCLGHESAYLFEKFYVQNMEKWSLAISISVRFEIAPVIKFCYLKLCVGSSFLGDELWNFLWKISLAPANTYLQKRTGQAFVFQPQKKYYSASEIPTWLSFSWDMSWGL